MKKTILKSLEIFVLSVFILSVFLGCRGNTQSVSGLKPIESSINTPVQESQLTNEDTVSSKQQESETSKTFSSETALIQSESTSLSTETVAIPDKSKFLTVDDVEKISGEKGIKLIDYDPSIGAGGDLNFAKPDGTMFLLAQIQQKTLWDEWKKNTELF